MSLARFVLAFLYRIVLLTAHGIRPIHGRWQRVFLRICPHNHDQTKATDMSWLARFFPSRRTAIALWIACWLGLLAGCSVPSTGFINAGMRILPTPPPFSPLPTPTPTPQGYTLPTRSLIDQCFFTPPPGGIPTEPIIPLSAYSFSPPQEIITHTAPIGIEQWLPIMRRC